MHGFHFALTALLLLTQGILADIALTSVNSTAYQQGSYGGFPNQTFRSSPVVAPLLDVKTWDKNSTDDAPFIVLNGQYGTGNGPLIYRTDDLSLVYANTTWNESLDVNIQSYNGQDYFTYWEGVNTQNTYYGYWSLYDSDYNLKYNFSSQNLDHLADMHDMVLTSNGTALMVIYDQVYPWNTTVVGGKENDTLEDALFQEVDVESGDVLFTWRLSDHYDINDTMVTYEEYGMREGGGGFDFGHINAISKTDDGNYLASFRHLCSVLLISPDGDIIWNLGGKRNNFTDLSDNRATDFCFQHDARFANAALTEITMFDNHQMSTDIHLSDENDCSRALHLKLDYDNMTAEVIDEYYHPDRIVAGAMGGYQTLGNGNKFVAWGFQPTITEHTDAGDVVLEIHMGPYGFPTHEAPEIYRAKKVAWVGRPPWKPSIAGTPPNGTDRGAYVSWNGATEYTKWAVLAANATDALDGYAQVVARGDRAGFETFVNVTDDRSGRYLRAAALDGDDAILGSTDAVDMRTGEVVPVAGDVTEVDEPSPTPSPTPSATGGALEPGSTDPEGAAGGTGRGNVWLLVAWVVAVSVVVVL